MTTNQPPDPKPCPFCGDSATLEVDEEHTASERWRVCCARLHNSGWWSNAGLAVERWNMRAHPTPQVSTTPLIQKLQNHIASMPIEQKQHHAGKLLIECLAALQSTQVSLPVKTSESFTIVPCPICGDKAATTAIEAYDRQSSAEKQKQIDLHCLDWAEAHTHAQNIALRLGVPKEKIEGDSNAVPGIEDLIDMIAVQAEANGVTKKKQRRIDLGMNHVTCGCNFNEAEETILKPCLAHSDWKAEAVKERDAEIERLRNVLEFYADPDTYFAIVFAFDPPCGAFIYDTDFNEEYQREIPGKLARATLATDGRKG